MNTKPIAVESFEQETAYADETSSALFEHPIDRLKYHILNTGGKILKSEFSVDGTGHVEWDSKGNKFSAWSVWPAAEYRVSWKKLA